VAFAALHVVVLANGLAPALRRPRREVAARAVPHRDPLPA
jgi:hypothetical protein